MNSALGVPPRFFQQQHFEVLKAEPGSNGLVRIGESHPKLPLLYCLLYNGVMSTIHKQLVTDEEGRPVGVLIPYEEWLRIEQQLGAATGANGTKQLQSHEGAIHLSEDPIAYQRRLRDEWA